MNVILIEKNETIVEKNVKIFDPDKLYSICGYRSNKEFKKLYQWEFDENIYELYGKNSGKSDKENKYKFPNDKEKYYGTLCVIKQNGSITLDEWNIFYMSFTTKNERNVNMSNINDNDDNMVESVDSSYINYIEDELTYEEYEKE